MYETRVPHPCITRAALAAALVGATLALAPGSARAAVPGGRDVVVSYRAAPVARRGSGPRAEAASAGRATPTVRVRTVRVPRGESVARYLKRLRSRRGVVSAQPDYVAHAAGGAHTADGLFYPDDRGRSGQPQGWEQMQWNLLDTADGIDAPQAWANLIADHRPGGRGVRIAVLDTGVAYRNWRDFKESPDLHQARFVDPYDFIANNRYPLDRDGHGTFVTSVIAESTNNSIGLTGIAYGATIMPVRVLSSNGLGDESTIAEGIRYAVAHKAQIINLSLEFVPSQVHSESQIPEIVSAIGYARRHGVLVIAASGNDQQRQLAYPAKVPGVVAVGATTADACVAAYSNTGSGLDLVAPGGGSDAILPSDPACHPERNLPPIYQMTLADPPHFNVFGYPSFYIGTSMSVPQVSAAAALVIASGVIGSHPTPNQVLNRLEQTATPLPTGGRQPNDTYGWGLLNVGAATSPLAIPSLSPR